MSVFLFFYGNNYQLFTLKQKKPDAFTIGHDIEQTVTIKPFPFTDGFLTITEDAVGYKVKQSGRLLGNLEAKRPFVMQEGNRRLTILHFRSVVEEGDYYVGAREEITISNVVEDAAIFKKESLDGGKDRLHFSFIKDGRDWIVSPGDSRVYVNGKKIGGNRKICLLYTSPSPRD